MKISEAIKQLQAIQEKFGDIKITGGYISDDTPLREISVTDTDGMEIYPHNRNRNKRKSITIDGVFLSA